MFAALVLLATAAQAYLPVTRLRVSANERLGLVRLRDDEALFAAVVHRKFSAEKPDALRTLVARVLAPYRDGLAVDPGKLAAIDRTWRAVAAGGEGGAGLDALALAVAELMGVTSDASGLTYDNDIDVLDIGDMYAIQLPIASARAADAASEALAPATRLGVARRISIARLTSKSEAHWLIADLDFGGAVLAASMDISPFVAAHRDTGHAFALLQERLDTSVADPATASSASIASAYRRYETASKAFDDEMNSTLDRLLARRIARDVGRIAVVAVLCLLIIALVVFSQISRATLERERRSMLAEQERARALERELERRRIERESVLNAAQFRTIFEVSPVGIATIDRDGRFVERNPAMTAMVEGKFDLFDASFEAPTFARLLTGEIPPHQMERRLVTESGEKWLDVTVFPIRITDGESVAAIAMFADVTERKASSERLRYDAAHDALTGLASRGEFLDDVRRAIETAADRRSLVMIDLDRFKFVNDTYGHAAGDVVLTTVAARLRSTTRRDDIVARLHGDEFALLVTTADDVELRVLAERVLGALREPIAIDGRSVCIDSSIGIARVEYGIGSAEELIRQADAAMYQAKRSGRGRYVYHDDEMHEKSAKYSRLGNDVLGALERGEFRVAYQPIVSLRDNTVRGFEALLRWRHPELGEVAPADFIAVTQERDSIGAVGLFALREAIAQVARWDRAFPDAPGISMSVNLFARQIDDEIVAHVEAALAEAAIGGDRLMLEVGESTLLESGAPMLQSLVALRAMGVRTCLVAFETGYSSLRKLEEFPIDFIKIDRSFVGDPSGGVASAPIVRMLVDLARSLRIGVIAEGIETQEQHEALLAFGCGLGQGFRFAPALAPSEIVLGRALVPNRHLLAVAPLSGAREWSPVSS